MNCLLSWDGRRANSLRESWQQLTQLLLLIRPKGLYCLYCLLLPFNNSLHLHQPKESVSSRWQRLSTVSWSAPVLHSTISQRVSLYPWSFLSSAIVLQLSTFLSVQGVSTVFLAAALLYTSTQHSHKCNSCLVASAVSILYDTLLYWWCIEADQYPSSPYYSVQVNSRLLNKIFCLCPPIPSYSRPLFHHTLTTVCLNYFVSLPHPFFRTPHSMLAINSKSSLSSVRIQSWHQPSVRSLMRSFLCPVCPYSFLPLQACCSWLQWVQL